MRLTEMRRNSIFRSNEQNSSYVGPDIGRATDDALTRLSHKQPLNHFTTRIDTDRRGNRVAVGYAKVLNDLTRTKYLMQQHYYTVSKKNPNIRRRRQKHARKPSWREGLIDLKFRKRSGKNVRKNQGDFFDSCCTNLARNQVFNTGI